MILPAPHGDKLDALLKNDKLPTSDRRRTEELVKRYRTWLASLTRLPTGNGGLTEAVRLLNEYRLFLDLEVVFNSQDDFLYRQKGQLKLDNTVIEEFLPHLVSRSFPDIATGFSVGPHSCFAALYFTKICQDAPLGRAGRNGSS